MRLFAGFVLAAFAVDAQVVISQIYGGGGNAGATFRNDFVELFNRGAQTVNINGWSVQYSAATAEIGRASCRERV